MFEVFGSKEDRIITVKGEARSSIKFETAEDADTEITNTFSEIAKLYPSAQLKDIVVEFSDGDNAPLHFMMVYELDKTAHIRQYDYFAIKVRRVYMAEFVQKMLKEKQCFYFKSIQISTAEWIIIFRKYTDEYLDCILNF